MSFKDYVDISQIATAIISLIGIIISVWLSTRALREVQADRKLNYKPYLLFEIGAFRLPIEFVKMGKAIPGINPDYVKKTFAHLPDDIESVRTKERKNNEKTELIYYGYLKNYGNGPAIDVEVTFIPKKVWIGTELFELTNEKLNEPLYNRQLNTIPASPSHITKETTGRLFRIPTFIEKDFEKKITKIEGTLKILCKDIFMNSHITKQGFRIFTHYNEDDKYIQVVFTDIYDI